jgi:hypothetical protein
MRPAVTILPAQASRIARETAETGAAVGVSQSGSLLTLDTGRATFVIDAGGHDIPNPSQEALC